MTVEPPGEPSASSGWPSPSTIVGRIELRGRLPPSTRFGWVNHRRRNSAQAAELAPMMMEEATEAAGGHVGVIN
jgi:hypothetical protein